MDALRDLKIVEVIVVAVEVLDALDRRALGLAGGFVRVTRMSAAREEDGVGSLGGEHVRSAGREVDDKVYDRRPSVDGKVIALGSSVESTYIVKARGGGATRSFLAWLV